VLVPMALKTDANGHDSSKKQSNNKLNQTPDPPEAQ